MLASFSITPVGAEDGDSVGRLVAAAVRVIRDSGLESSTSAGFTDIEGEWDDVMAVIKQATDVVMEQAPRCTIVIKADVRPGHPDMLRTKIASVERYLTE
jgi:uncharacterized protein (TIGR00106 family)